MPAIRSLLGFPLALVLLSTITLTGGCGDDAPPPAGPVGAAGTSTCDAASGACFITGGAAGADAAAGYGNRETYQESGVINVESGAQTGSKSGRVDLLFVVDNSISMADKQQILKLAVPDLIDSIVNPSCISTRTGESVRMPTVDDPCPPEAPQRQFKPVKDMHIGIVTSSLGDHGSGDLCSPKNANFTDSQNDMGHMLGSLARNKVSTPSDLGFLVWDPEHKDMQLSGGHDSRDKLVEDFQTMVTEVGQDGCGYEATLEAWYRFLVNPSPYETVGRKSCGGSDTDGCADPTGLDNTLLEERKAFLRPDSALLIMMLTDENDCSVKDTGQAHLVHNTQFLFPAGSSACETNPNDKCCYACTSSAVPAGCPQPDSSCTMDRDGDGNPNQTLTPDTDALNLRCYKQKARFGIDFLYPVQRYVDAMTKDVVPDRFNKPVPNPLFAEGTGIDGKPTKRPHDKAFLIGILGMPWQDVATEDTLDSKDRLYLKPSKSVDWDLILGDPSNGVDPKDPLMIESVDPRAGVNPVTKEKLAAPGAGSMENKINGHERTILRADDLQYACIFPLGKSRDCEASTSGDCECVTPDDGSNNPLCQDPKSGSYSTVQHYAKAYPSLRVIEALKGVAPQSVVSSICPKQFDDDSTQDYGYRPVIGTILNQVAEKLR